MSDECIKVTVHAEIIYLEQEVCVYEDDDEASIQRRVEEAFFQDGVETPYSGWVTRVVVPPGAIEKAKEAYAHA